MYVTMDDELLLEQDGPVCTLSINRPEKRNLLTNRCLEEMVRCLEGLSREDLVRVVVIRGAGDQAFSAGYDITALPVQPTTEARGALRRDPPLERAMRAVESFPYPVIAMINGLAYGGGCELAVSCDLRIAAENAFMGMPPAKLGLVYPYEGLRRFVSVIGFSRALEVFLTARRYDSASCLRLGLVNEVVEDDDLVDHTLHLAGEIAENAPLSLRGTKLALHRIARYPILDPEDENAIRSLFVRSLESEDMAEAKQAFLEKRKPRFKGK
ncbi:MAG: enoyl-CoA hydratase-related protein [Desulfobacteraceae bacterium]